MFALLPPATRALIAANFIVFALQWLTHDAFSGLFALQPLGPDFHIWQVVTYAFLHDRTFLPHILLNMFAVFMFGPPLERFFGSGRFLALYFASVLAAAGAQLATTQLSGADESTIGASGAVFGLLFAFAFYFPRQRLMLLFPPIPMPAWLFVTLYGLLELTLGVTGKEASVAHFAHLGGMAGAALVILYWRAHDHSPRW
ncbi:MAG TPA: rhomboid family intramembrane serine protease [Steroidobacteraceae bacterium]|nr:rhomboid family intramembrane serine protease [Steroidobacteraceae bacterium]